MPENASRQHPGTSLTPMRMAAFAGVGLIVWWFIIAAVLGLLECAP